MNYFKISVTQEALELFTFGSEQACLQCTVYVCGCCWHLILGCNGERGGYARWEIGFCVMEGRLLFPWLSV